MFLISVQFYNKDPRCSADNVPFRAVILCRSVPVWHACLDDYVTVTTTHVRLLLILCVCVCHILLCVHVTLEVSFLSSCTKNIRLVK